jgi:ribosomal protein S24E
MKYPKDFGYMSIIETITDVDNTFLSRRELTCNFAGLGGKLKKLEAVEMITKEFKLDGKVVIPMGLKNHVGKPLITGTFYVYDDEGLAKKQVNPTIFSRLERTKAKLAEAEKATEEAVVEEKPAKDAEVKAEEKPAKDAEVKAKESKEEEKSK